MGASTSEIGAKAITSDVLHFMLVGKWRDSALWILFCEFLVQEYEIRETTANFYEGFLERRKVGLQTQVSSSTRKCDVDIEGIAHTCVVIR